MKRYKAVTFEYDDSLEAGTALDIIEDENGEWVKYEDAIKLQNYVPYQKCPVCDGGGQIFSGDLSENYTLTTNIRTTCHVCNGRGVIPMCIMKKVEDKESE